LKHWYYKQGSLPDCWPYLMKSYLQSLFLMVCVMNPSGVLSGCNDVSINIF
jgi:hypothetical protein